jgi:hypothetical protein
MTRILTVCRCLCLLAVGAALLWLAWAMSDLIFDVRGRLQRIEPQISAAAAEIQQTRGDLAILEAGLLNEAFAWRQGAAPVLTEARQTLAVYRGVAEAAKPVINAIPPAVGAAQAAFLALPPVLEEAKLDLKDMRDIADDLYPDIKAGVESGTVAARSVAEMATAGEHMAVALEKETPATAAAVRSTSQDMAVIVHRITKPVSWLKGVAGTALSWAGKFFGF